jgi:hypothetical protein
VLYESDILERILIRYYKKKATSIWFEMWYGNLMPLSTSFQPYRGHGGTPHTHSKPRKCGKLLMHAVVSSTYSLTTWVCLVIFIVSTSTYKSHAHTIRDFAVPDFSTLVQCMFILQILCWNQIEMRNLFIVKCHWIHCRNYIWS